MPSTDWDSMARERKVLQWIDYWLAWSDQTGVQDLSPKPPPPTSEKILALMEEFRTERVKGRRALP